MLVGITPYFSPNKETLEDNILYGKLKLPRKISKEVRDLIIQLLNRNPSKRIGSAPGEMGAHEITVIRRISKNTLYFKFC